MAKSKSERKRNYMHIRHMQNDMGLDRADILAYAGHKFKYDNGGLESIAHLDDDELDNLIFSMRAYLDFHKIMISSPDKALGLAKRITQVYSYTPLSRPSETENDPVEELDENETEALKSPCMGS